MALVRDQDAARQLQVSRRYLNDKSGLMAAEIRPEKGRAVHYYEPADVQAWADERDNKRAE